MRARTNGPARWLAPARSPYQRREVHRANPQTGKKPRSLGPHLLRHPTKLHRLQENIGAVDVVLSDADRGEIDR
jgi:hypothetical protein